MPKYRRFPSKKHIWCQGCNNKVSHLWNQRCFDRSEGKEIMRCELCIMHGLGARMAELERVIHGAHGWATIALGILRNRPWPTPNAEAYLPLEDALAEIIAATQPKR